MSREGAMERSEIERRIVDGSVWEDFCDRLKQAGSEAIKGCEQEFGA